MFLGGFYVGIINNRFERLVDGSTVGVTKNLFKAKNKFLSYSLFRDRYICIKIHFLFVLYI